MISYSDRLASLYKLEFFGMKLGLENITRLLEFLGRPDRAFPSIHVAGTNGKGSVSAMLAAIHQASGKKTGLYTSPHLVDFRERIRVNGEMISKREVSRFLGNVWPTVEKLHATFFEVTTAMAFDHFMRHQVDIAIIETGLGGRLDATNVLEHPLVTVVTSIGLDHTAQLGPTLESIAQEKAGIFKPHVTAVVNCDRALEPVFLSRARQSHSPLVLVRKSKVLFQGEPDWKPPSPGRHQKSNVDTVRAVISALPYHIPIGKARNGVRNAPALTGLRARLEEIRDPNLSRRKIRLFLDVGHNPQAIEAVLDFFKREQKRKGAIIVVGGIMKDKNATEILATIKKFASAFIAINAKTERALSSKELHATANVAGIPSTNGGSVQNGLAIAFKTARSGDTILLIGSHYVVGEFLENFQRTGRVLKREK